VEFLKVADFNAEKMYLLMASYQLSSRSNQENVEHWPPPPPHDTELCSKMYPNQWLYIVANFSLH
jgi:hypothetical protein